MTAIASILLDAFRESNILPLGKAPNALQSGEALRLLQQLFSATYGSDAGESLQDFPLGAFDRDAPLDSPTDISVICRQYPPINQRLLATNINVLEVYLTPYPQDGSRMALIDPYSRLSAVPVTLDGNGRTIEGSPTLLLDTDGISREWFYRADLGDWVRIVGITEDGEMPFPADFDIMWTIFLAMRINPRYGRTLDPQSISMLKQNKRDFVARYLQSRPLDLDDSLSWPFMSTQSYDTQRTFSSNRAFARGDYSAG